MGNSISESKLPDQTLSTILRDKAVEARSNNVKSLVEDIVVEPLNIKDYTAKYHDDINKLADDIIEDCHEAASRGKSWYVYRLQLGGGDFAPFKRKQVPFIISCGDDNCSVLNNLLIKKGLNSRITITDYAMDNNLSIKWDDVYY